MHTNALIYETSPYLLQHANNPVNWYPWGREAFEKARRENKPVFISIGYSTCHWCHVMAHESFEDEEVAEALNRSFVSIKVDREERPDIDGVYMRACQAMTGRGGWPMSIFADADGKPFYAGNYFTKPYFLKLIEALDEQWENNRDGVLSQSARVAEALNRTRESDADDAEYPSQKYIVSMYESGFDKDFGGFGGAPKFPSGHAMMYLMRTAPYMAETTLKQMFYGGIFDHVGGGFCRYSTDRFWLAPHFEKMLYTNAWLAAAYLMAYEETGDDFYKEVAIRVFSYLEKEMASPDGGFYSAQDADSEGEEGRFYVFSKSELIDLLGNEDGERFCNYFGVSEGGNFQDKNILNLINNPDHPGKMDDLIKRVYEYRKNRAKLHTDKKRLTSSNALTAAAYAMAGRITGDESFTKKAEKTISFIESKLTEGDVVFAGISGDKRMGAGFIDDYAFYIFALLQMYEASFENRYLLRALELTKKVCRDFWDEKDGGFFFSGTENEKLFSRPKETFDGALPSGNSMMSFVLSRIALLTEDETFEAISNSQTAFMNAQSAGRPVAYAFYLYSRLPVKKIVCVTKDGMTPKGLHVRSDWAFLLAGETDEYRLLNDKTTYYVCEGELCYPPANELE
ncbi:MAG: thioredoxin domain-containing protein [Clostridia bacterium]|nr:thioredoxin domain-containing protein [Clostridia bacterium]